MSALRPGDAVLVTGAAGLIGGWIIDHLVSHGFKVIATDLADGESRSSVEWVSGDVCDSQFVTEVFEKYIPSGVIHCASMLLFSCENVPEKAIEVNVGGTRNMLDAAVRMRCERFIYLSTSAVYGAQVGVLKEDALIGAPHGLLGVYSATKWLAERLGLAANKTSGLQFVAFRPGFVFGLGVPKSAGMSDVIQRMYKALLCGERYEVKEASGKEEWHFVHVSEICAAALAALTVQSDPTGIYNLAGRPDMYVSLDRFIDEVGKSAGHKAHGSLTGSATSGPFLDLHNITERVGFSPTISISEAVRRDRQVLEIGR